jgi:molybdopterin/thiamine biosynthesis adenylyltransferase
VAGAGDLALIAVATLRMTEGDYLALRQHLFPGDGNEAAAIALCGRLDAGPHQVLLIREIHPVPYEVCTIHSPVTVAWPSNWLDPLLTRAARENLSVVKFHSHPNHYPKFSGQDDESDQRLFDGIQGWLDDDRPHGSVVMLPNGDLFGRMIDGDGGHHPLDKIAAVGDTIRFWHHNPPALPANLKGVGRNTSAFGAMMTADLAKLTAAVGGASGTGSPTLEQMGRLGFGRIVPIDSQLAEIRNLNRIVNCTRADAENGETKVAIARRAIEAMGLGSVVDDQPLNLVSREAVSAVAACDVIIGCLDSAEGRDILNRISTYYLLPYVDIGVSIVALEDGTIDQVNGIVHYLQPGKSSLLSRGAYTAEQVGIDAMRRRNPEVYADRLKEKYIRGAAEDAPAVVSINMTMAGMAVTELLSRLYTIRNEHESRYATTRVNFCEMTMDHEPEKGQCLVLVKYVGRGDANPPLGLPELSR